MRIAVVLGNRMNDDGSFSSKMLRRLALTVKLYREENPDYIILSGGMANPKAGIAESRAMFNYLTSKGIPADAFIVEDSSMTTTENAAFSVPKAMELGADEILLCTSHEHMYRKYLNPKKLFAKKIKKCQANIKLTPYSD